MVDVQLEIGQNDTGCANNIWNDEELAENARYKQKSILGVEKSGENLSD